MPDCLFCRVIKKEIKSRIEYEDDDFLAIHDIHAQAPAHILVMPKRHIERISDLKDSDEALIGRVILRARQIAARNNWNDYRLVFNNGPESGQSVFHIHLHLLAGRRMHWPPG